MSGVEMDFVRNAFESNWIAPLGPQVDAFEREIAKKVGANESVVLSSGTAAIHLALSLLGVKQGDKVFCSTLTFVASANPILYQGAEPVFIDSDPESWNMSPQALDQALQDAFKNKELPKAIIVVNLYGQSANMDSLLALCERYQIPVIEDAAESLGATYKGKQSGTFGHFGIYSFNGNKIITTSGGGALVSNDKEALKKARFLATQARDPAPHYQHSILGYNYRMSNLLAAIGRAQLQHLEQRVEAKREVFQKYFEELSHLPGISFMPEYEGSRSNRWLTTLTIDSNLSGVTAQQLVERLNEQNIEARPVWKPLHLQPLFKGVKYFPHQENEDVARALFENGICLPSGTNITEEEQQRVIHHVKKAVYIQDIKEEYEV